MTSLGTPFSARLFPEPGWTHTTAAEVGDGPYPGHRPDGSWLLRGDGAVESLRPVEAGRHADLTGRHLVIGYGSNPNPNKLLTHPDLFASGDVIALRAAIVGWAAVWSDSRRAIDGSVVAIFAPLAGRVEVHPLLAVTDDQLEIMDRWEHVPIAYQRVHHDGPVLLENGTLAEGVQVYLGTPDVRPPLLVDGQPVLCADMRYDEVDRRVART